MGKDLKKKKIIMIILIIIGILLVAGGTYALIYEMFNGTNTNTIRTGTIRFVYNEPSSNVSINNIGLTDNEAMTSSDYFEFDVQATATGKTEIGYFIYLTFDEDNTIPNEAIKVGLTSITGTGMNISDETLLIKEYASNLTLLDNTIFHDIGSTNDYFLYSKTFNFMTNQAPKTDYYRLRLWYDKDYFTNNSIINNEGINEIDITNGTFKAKINVYGKDGEITNNIDIPTITSFTHLGSGVINVIANDTSGLDSICINTHATDVTGCSWKTYTTGTYETILTTAGTYYAHVKNNIENIRHSNGLIFNLDTSEANRPELAEGMIPVYYDSTSNVWRKADSGNGNASYKWYNYDEHMWANAVTVNEIDGSRTDLVNSLLGTEIPMSRINTMLVWIPRFNAVVPASQGVIDVTFVDENTEALDAFTFGNQNLTGYWVGKFELSSDVTCIAASGSALGSGCNLNTINPKVLPNVKSWAGAQVSTFYNRMLAMKNNTSVYGFNTTIDTTLDTHMIKNNEWGAVAYLTQSNYGRCISGVCSEVWRNPVNTLNGANSQYGSGITGCSGSSVDASIQNSMSACTSSYEYNGTNNNGNSSTTGNVYGIYDMNGGLGDYVMGNFNNIIGTSGFSSIPTSPYIDVYTGTAYQGHALSETQGWYGDYAYFINSTYSWLVRGGVYDNTSNSGLFAFYFNSGNSDRAYGSRVSVTK